MCNHIAKLCTCKGFSLYSILWCTLLEGPWEPLYQAIAFCSWICQFVLLFYQLDDLPWSFLWHILAVYLKGLLSFVLFFSFKWGTYTMVHVPFHEFNNILICMLEAFKGTHWNKRDELSAYIWCFEQEFCIKFPTGRQEMLRLSQSYVTWIWHDCLGTWRHGHVASGFKGGKGFMWRCKIRTQECGLGSKTWLKWPVQPWLVAELL